MLRTIRNWIITLICKCLKDKIRVLREEIYHLELTSPPYFELLHEIVHLFIWINSLVYFLVMQCHLRVVEEGVQGCECSYDISSQLRALNDVVHYQVQSMC